MVSPSEKVPSKQEDVTYSMAAPVAWGGGGHVTWKYATLASALFSAKDNQDNKNSWLNKNFYVSLNHLKEFK